MYKYLMAPTPSTAASCRGIRNLFPIAFTDARYFAIIPAVTRLDNGRSPSIARRHRVDTIAEAAPM